MWSYRNLPTIRRKYFLDVQSGIFRLEGSRKKQQLSCRLYKYTSYSCSFMTQSNDPFLSTTSASTGSLLDITLKNIIITMCVAVNTQTILPAEFVGNYVCCLSVSNFTCPSAVFQCLPPSNRKLKSILHSMTVLFGIIIIIIIIIFIYCNWVVTRWQWLFYLYTKHEIGTKHEIQEITSMFGNFLLTKYIAVCVCVCIYINKSFLFWNFQDIFLKTEMNFFNRRLFAIQVMTITIYIMYYDFCILEPF